MSLPGAATIRGAQPLTLQSRAYIIVVANLGVRSREVSEGLTLVSRDVVGNHVGFFAARLVDCDIGQEGNELGRAMARGGHAQHIAGLGVEGGVPGQRSMTESVAASTRVCATRTQSSCG